MVLARHGNTDVDLGLIHFRLLLFPLYPLFCGWDRSEGELLLSRERFVGGPLE